MATSPWVLEVLTVWIRAAFQSQNLSHILSVPVRLDRHHGPQCLKLSRCKMLFSVGQLPSTLYGIFLTFPVARSLIALVAHYLLYNASILLIFFHPPVESKLEAEVISGTDSSHFVTFLLLYCTYDSRMSPWIIPSRHTTSSCSQMKRNGIYDVPQMCSPSSVRSTSVRSMREPLGRSIL